MSSTRRVLSGLGVVAAVAAALAFVAAAYVYVASERVIHRQYEAPLEPVAVPSDPASIAEGRRLATIRGCYGGCHGKGIEGEVWVDDVREGRAVAPNLTALAHDYSPAELARVIRYGVRPNGEGVQIMPSPMFYHLSDADLGRIIAFLRSVPRMDGHPYEFRPGPYTRWMIAKGEWLPWPEDIAVMGPRMPTPSAADTLRFGEYLARTVCTECHGNELEGGDGTPDLVIGAAYCPADFARLMRTGVALGSREVGLMSEVARSGSATSPMPRSSRCTPSSKHALRSTQPRAGGR